ncbi:histidine--tRNA ligase [Pontibacter sp. BT310]|uniref:Histidine--tRNA ligase n=1 Tax=Pontibacter populi TaxID=890055 RepID=A0ABS6XDM1_9BACT|nr:MULTISPECIES: histidine--tRNA ligase [Pontibacter]MBJ6118431.1 histidine--tRNA ligase [Pontibacter sp. BT310]MBR0570859.1 histidine--tRNA ligase [Microvirga sp. STS03]MBW3365285.1 histidine--tRNA ligase [Pontibacter populi]
MSKEKPSLPKGTRDFGPAVVAKRNYIFNTIRRTFEKFGYLPLETPAMEQLSVLTGKYGDEGDQLIFKILNSGDYLGKTTPADIEQGSKHLIRKISEKALRYDLTVPFARFVVMNRNEITFPFKRYQIQPVWRADRPQKGRYREFYQCDADVVGTNSLLCEAEIVQMIDEVLTTLGLTDFTIKINHRGVLAGIAEAIGEKGREGDICVAIDKLDKIGAEGVRKELLERGISEEAVGKLEPLYSLEGDNQNLLQQLQTILGNTEEGQRGLKDLNEVWTYLDNLGSNALTTENPSGNPRLQLDVTLARGLSYYTGCIFEVKVNNVSMGSISGGGRYDNLTGMFGLPGVSGVGFSFGVDRIYDVLEELDLFPANAQMSTKVLIVQFDKESELYALPLLQKLRDAGISSELYPEAAKLKKQMGYADQKNIPFVLLVGSEEMASGKLKLRDMQTGEQDELYIDDIIAQLKDIA